MIGLYKKNINIVTFNFNKILPVFSYSVATFFLMDFAFFIDNIVDLLHFTYLEAFILLGIPFIGRMFTPFIYAPLARMGVPRLALFSISVMSIISFLISYEKTFPEMFISRFLIGIFYGTATSAAIEVSSITKNRIIIGLTMGGWAIGWLIAAVFFMFLKSWSLVSLIGIVFVPAIIFSKKHNVISPLVKKFQFDFSFKIFILFILGFTPAYILEVVPSFLGSASLYESIIAYSFAVPAYIILPYLINRISIYKIFYASVVIVSLSGIIFFLTDDIVLAVIFTVFGLGMISLLPIISRNLNVEPKKIGPSMNFAAVSGFLLPVILPIGIEYINIIATVILFGIATIIFTKFETGSKFWKNIILSKNIIKH